MKRVVVISAVQSHLDNEGSLCEASEGRNKKKIVNLKEFQEEFFVALQWVFICILVL